MEHNSIHLNQPMFTEVIKPLAWHRLRTGTRTTNYTGRTQSGTVGTITSNYKGIEH